jgi:hypothetical protein
VPVDETRTGDELEVDDESATIPIAPTTIRATATKAVVAVPIAVLRGPTDARRDYGVYSSSAENMATHPTRLPADGLGRTRAFQNEPRRGVFCLPQVGREDVE